MVYQLCKIKNIKEKKLIKINESILFSFKNESLSKLTNTHDKAVRTVKLSRRFFFWVGNESKLNLEM